MIKLDTTKDIDSALIWAAQAGDLDDVKYCVEQGAEIHANNDLSLIWAAESGHTDVVEYLVEQGASNRIYEEYALRWTAGGHSGIVEYLESLAHD